MRYYAVIDYSDTPTINCFFFVTPQWNRLFGTSAPPSRISTKTPLFMMLQMPFSQGRYLKKEINSLMLHNIL